jgi:hypothetical protein
MADLSKIVDELSSLTVLEAAELAKLLQERWQPPNVTLADIKNELPAWPDDVIHQWLHYFANEPDCGWPPPEPLGDHRWSRLLGGRPLSWWKNVTWKKEKVKCELDSLSPKARADVTDIVAQMKSGAADTGTKKRVAQSWIYIKDNAVFPRALVTMRIPGGLSLLDGSHRMAAFTMVQELDSKQFEKINKKKPALEQEVWVGTHSRGEVPVM